MDNRHEVVSVKNEDVKELGTELASRVKLQRRSCTSKINFSKYEQEYCTDKDIDPDFELPDVLSPKKPHFTFNKLKNKKKKYTKRQKSLRKFKNILHACILCD